MPRVSYPNRIQNNLNGAATTGTSDRQNGTKSANKNTVVSLSNVEDYNGKTVNVYGIVTSASPHALDKFGKHCVKIRIIDDSRSSPCTLQLHSVKESALPKPQSIGDVMYVSDVQVQVSKWNAVFLGNYSPEASIICMRSWDATVNKFVSADQNFPDPKRAQDLAQYAKECMLRDCSFVSNNYTYTLQQCYAKNYADIICFVLDIKDTFCTLTDSSMHGKTITMNIERNVDKRFHAQEIQANCCYKFVNVKVERYQDGFYLNFFSKSSVIKVPSYSRAFEEARGYENENHDTLVNMNESSYTNQVPDTDKLDSIASEVVEFPKRFCGKILDAELSQKDIMSLDSILHCVEKLSPPTDAIFRTRVRVLDYFPHEPSQMVRMNQCNTQLEYRLCFKIADMTASYECYLNGPEAQSFFKHVPADNVGMTNKTNGEPMINKYIRTLLSQCCWIDCCLKYVQCMQTNKKVLQLVRTEFLVPRV